MMDEGIELEPWVVVLGEAPETELATWNIEANGHPALALFSAKDKAETYAQANCSETGQVLQLGQRELLQVLIDCFNQHTLFAVLDPVGAEARQVFRVKEILAAAKQQLKSQQSKGQQ
ncbi:MAG: hypothetical protein AAF483_15910 [Planctomycetota bacterium]